MGYFESAAEVDRYIGGILRAAGQDPEVARALAAAEVTLKIQCTEPDCEITVALEDPIQVLIGPTKRKADVTLTMPSDVADRYWRGEYTLSTGLAKGEVRARGPVNKVLKLVPATKPMFPVYKAMVAEKDDELAATGRA